MGELFKRIDVCVLKAFRCRIGRGNSQTFGSGNRTDDSQMSASIVPEIGKAVSTIRVKPSTLVRAVFSSISIFNSIFWKPMPELSKNKSIPPSWWISASSFPALYSWVTSSDWILSVPVRFAGTLRELTGVFPLCRSAILRTGGVGQLPFRYRRWRLW